MALKAESSRDYQDYEPNTEIVQEEDCDTLLVHLPGFRKQQLRIQLTPNRTLRVSGERPIEGNKWIRVQKEYPVPTNCDTNKITARFDVKILYIRQPKLITPVVHKDEEKPKQETQDTHKDEAKPPTAFQKDKEKPENETKPQPPLPQTTEMKNGYGQRDETKSGEKMEDEDEVSSKFNSSDDGDMAQKSREENGDKVNSKSNMADDGDTAQKSREEEKEPRKGDMGNEKGKKDDELKRGKPMTGRVEMAKKLARLMTVLVVVFSVVALGIYVKNLIITTMNNEK